MNLNHPLRLLFAVCVLLFSQVGISIASENFQIGYVDIRKIMENAPQLEGIQQKLDSEFDEKRKKIFSLRNEIAKLTNALDEFSSQRDKDKEQKLQSMSKNIDDKQILLIKIQQRYNESYNLRRNQYLANLQSLVVKMVTKVAKKHNKQIVFNGAGIIYKNAAIDITPEVLEELASVKK